MRTIATLDDKLWVDPPNSPRWRPVVVADDHPERDDAAWLTTLLLVGAA